LVAAGFFGVVAGVGGLLSGTMLGLALGRTRPKTPLLEEPHPSTAKTQPEMALAAHPPESAQSTQIRALFTRLNRPDLDPEVKQLLVETEARVADGLRRVVELEQSRQLEHALGESPERSARLAEVRERAEREVNALIDHVRDLHVEALARGSGSSAEISRRLRDALQRMAAEAEVARETVPLRRERSLSSDEGSSAAKTRIAERA
jgi:hypothetical protein